MFCQVPLIIILTSHCMNQLLIYQKWDFLHTKLHLFSRKIVGRRKWVVSKLFTFHFFRYFSVDKKHTFNILENFYLFLNFCLCTIEDGGNWVINKLTACRNIFLLIWSKATQSSWDGEHEIVSKYLSLYGQHKEWKTR